MVLSVTTLQSPFKPAASASVAPFPLLRGRDRAVDLSLALLVAFAGLLARLHAIGDKPFWLDEVTTLRRSSLNAHDLITDSLSFHHLPLYFLISRWFIPLGTDEASLRLPAALFGALSCALLFGATRLVGGRRAALAASLLMALSPFQVQYGQEARSYTLVISFIIAALWALMALARDPARAALPFRNPAAARLPWLAYTLATIGALDTLSVALFWPLAALTVLGLMAARHPRLRPGLLRNTSITHLAICAAYLPFVVAMHQLTHGDMGSGLDWVPPLTPHRIWTTLQAVYLLRTTSLIRFHTFPVGLPWLGLLTALLAFWGLWRATRPGMDQRRPAFAATVALVSLPLGLLLTSLVSSVWMPRYLAWSGPIFYLFAGLGFAFLPRPAGRAALALLPALCLINLWPYYRAETKPLWDKAALTLRENLSPEALLVTDDPGAIDMMNVRLRRLGEPIPASVWTSNTDRALQHLRDGFPVWAVHGRIGQADHTPLAAFNSMTSPLGEPCWSSNVGIDIVIEAFAPEGGACPAPDDL